MSDTHKGGCLCGSDRYQVNLELQKWHLSVTAAIVSCGAAAPSASLSTLRKIKFNWETVR